MLCAKFPLFLFISVFSARADFIEKTSDTYGPYSVHWDGYYSCRGPKLVNLTTYTTTMMRQSGAYLGAINMTFLEQTRIEEIKMAMYSVKGDRKVLLWNYVMNKPCQHYGMSKIMEAQANAQNCVVKKGTYYSDLNFSEVIHSYLGNSFFYGEFAFKVLVLSKKGNILCLMFNPVFKKKV